MLDENTICGHQINEYFNTVKQLSKEQILYVEQLLAVTHAKVDVLKKLSTGENSTIENPLEILYGEIDLKLDEAIQIIIHTCYEQHTQLNKNRLDEA